MAAAFTMFLLLSGVTAAAAQQRNSNISLGSSLTPTTNLSWFSPSRIFAFGFYQQQNGYSVGIFLASFSERTVVWTANRDNPIFPNNVNLLLTNDGRLILRQGEGQDIYSQIANPHQPIAWASMLDNGNFVLYNSDAIVIWQSFDHPTDTLLPGQRLSPGGELFSRASETDFTIGTFRLKMQTNGNLEQYPVNTPDTAVYAYFGSNTAGAGNNVSLNLENDGRLYLSNGSSVVKNVSRGGYPVARTMIYRMRIDVDGIFRVYYRSLDRESNWTSIWLSTKDKCRPKGLCGLNSFCTYLDQIVDCKCLPGFDFDRSGNSTAGCTRNFTVEGCANKNPSVKYEIGTIPNVTWEDNSYAVLYTITEEHCGRACLDDCNCDAAFFKDLKCRKQRLPLRYGRMSPRDSSMALLKLSTRAPETIGASDNSENMRGLTRGSRIICGEVKLIEDVALRTFTYADLAQATNDFKEEHRALFIKGSYRIAIELVNPTQQNSHISNSFGSKKGLSDLQKYVIIGVSLGIGGLVILSIIVYYITKQCRLCDQGMESNQNVDKFLLNHGSLAPKRYSYNEIKKITKSFTDKLGQGGYGIVYKGQLPNGQLVAVKVLTETHDNAEEFINEVASISRTSHVNIVNLLGFFYDRKKRALVYEFMPNKSLDKFIYKSGSVDPECSLEWEKLNEIAVGVARGLEYLHRGCNTRIVHFDIKPQNILLDEDFCPKISDFGLAKLFKKKQSIISMLGARGTIGYIAPEVFSRNFGVVSHKSDVYSYGMMLLEMAEERKIVEIEAIQSSENYFPDKIYKHVLLKNENLGDLMIEEKEETALKMLLVGFWCIQTAPSDRPSMTKVVEMLEGSLQSIQIPPKPVLSSPQLSVPQFSSSFSVNVEIENSPAARRKSKPAALNGFVATSAEPHS